MTINPTAELPEDLKERLLAAGVEDEASLQAALEADPQLRQAYESWLIGMVLQAFAATPDPAALRALLARAPILMEQPVIDAIEQAIARARAAGDEDSATALAQRLVVLREIKAEQEAAREPPLAQALIRFLQASDEEAAGVVFDLDRALLDSDDAEAFLLNQFEAEDETARVLLERRLELLRRLRM